MRGNGAEARRVLVVDDNVELAENIAELLGLAGYVVVLASSAEEALPLALAGGVFFVVTDYRLPGRSGADLIRDLRSRGWTMPAVVMSAYTDEGTVAAARDAGIADFIPKPVDLQRLTQVIGATA
jgi:DNA-binding NtrC family response regulator